MSDQPKPASGEWTAGTLRQIFNDNEWIDDFFAKIADAHNAALAAEREKVQKMCQVAYDWMLSGESIENLPNELQCIADTALAAERETQIITHVCKDPIDCVRQSNQLREQLDAERDATQIQGKALRQLREQLAAERDATQIQGKALRQLREQLAAEREKVQTLRDVLTKVRHGIGDWDATADYIDAALAKVKP